VSVSGDDTAALRDALARLLGAEHVLAGDGPGVAHYGHDATSARGLRGRADLVVRPGSAAEVAAVLACCYEHEVPLIARGGGTGLAGGAVPLAGGVVCALERVRAIRALEPELWRMHVEAGLRTCEVQRLARERGLCFPPDPGAAEQSQIGGNVATNAGGPHACKYGVTGAWVTGLEVALAPGELVEVGGPYRKDVGGYDLKSLLIGSEGTLGIVTAVRLRLLPAPEDALPLLAFFPTQAAGCAAILEVLASGVECAALDFLDGDALRIAAGAWEGGELRLPTGAAFALLAEVDGTREAARAAHAELVEVLAPGALALVGARGGQPSHDGRADPARDLDRDALWRWRDRVAGAVSAVRGGKVSEDVVVPVERLAEALERFAAIAARHGLRACAWGHGADGNVHANLLVDPANAVDRAAARDATDELFALAVELGGAISGEHGVGALKRGQLARQWAPRALELHEQIKRAFDPKGLLNPGKKLARTPGRVA
jgi:glycolate oxidase subunit GlcD